MLKLLRWDLDWILSLSLVAFALGFLVLGGVSRVDLFVVPFGVPVEGLFFTVSTLGLVLGVFVGLRDRLARTEDWLRQRPIGERELALRRHLTSLLVLTVWIVLPLLLRRVLTFAGDRDLRGLAYPVADDPARWGELLALVPLAFAGYALAYFATRAPGAYPVKGISGILLTATWLFCSWCFLEDVWRLGAPGFALLQCAFAALVLWAAFLSERGAGDRDHPAGRRALRADLVLLGLAAVLGAGIVVTEIQSRFHASLDAAWPEIHRFGEDFVLIGSEKVGPERYEARLMDEEHRFVEGEVPDWSFRTRVGRPAHDPRRDSLHNDFLELGLGEIRRGSFNAVNRLFVAAPGLVIHSLRDSSPEDGSGLPTYFRRALAREDGGRFSTEVGFSRWPGHWGQRGRQDPATGAWRVQDLGGPVVHDPVDESWWRADLEAGVLRRLALPEGELILDCYPIAGEDSRSEWAEIRFLGRFGDYRLDADGLVAVAGPERASRGLLVETEDADPLGPLLVVRDRDGRELYRHRYGLHRGEEKALGAVVLGAGLLRAPIAQIASAFQGDLPAWTKKEVRAVFDPFTAGGRRPWLVGLSLLLGAGLALVQGRRLARFGAGRPRRRLWFLAILLGGPALFLLGILLERPRAHRALELPEAARMLLKSA